METRGLVLTVRNRNRRVAAVAVGIQTSHDGHLTRCPVNRRSPFTNCICVHVGVDSSCTVGTARRLYQPP